MECSCDPPYKQGYPYSQWIGSWFGDCIYTPQEHLAFGFGFLSMILYMIAMFPQFYKNYQRKSVEGLSLTFLLIWAFGDLSNFLGAILTGQFRTVQFLGFYFLLMGIFSLLQYVWYRKRRITEEEAHLLESESDDSSLDVQPFRSFSISLIFSFVLIAVLYQKQFFGPLNNGFMLKSADICNAKPSLPPYIQTIGICLAWFSGLLYFSSRLPQIILNYQLKSVKGLSVFLFMATILGNLCYGLQIILRGEWTEQMMIQIPYLLGSIGTFVFDFVVIWQAYLYRPVNVFGVIE